MLHLPWPRLPLTWRKLQLANRPPSASRAKACLGRRQAFTLTELLVAVAVISLLMSLSAVAVNAARNSQKVNQTRLTISKIDRILTEQLRRYNSRYVSPTAITTAASDAGVTFASSITGAQKRSWYIRRNLISGDMPDRWADVAYLASFPNVLKSSSQEAYRKLWASLDTAARARVPTTNSDAECLFMVVMHGGFADCLDCGPIRSAEIGDTDGDEMPEFSDAWGNPIGFLLWAPKFELPLGTSFFQLQKPFAVASPSPLLGMRPLIYSSGSDGLSGYNMGTETLSSLSLGLECGNPDAAAMSTRGGPAGPLVTDYRRDNVTNFDGEVRP